MQGIAMPKMHLARVVVDDASAKRQLNIGMRCIALGRHKALCFRHIGSNPSCALGSPL